MGHPVLLVARPRRSALNAQPWRSERRNTGALAAMVRRSIKRGGCFDARHLGPRVYESLLHACPLKIHALSPDPAVLLKKWITEDAQP